MSVHRVCLKLAVLLLVGAGSAYAQTPGLICGTVTDPSGAGLADVAVMLQPRDGAALPATALTTAQGDYLFPSVAIGTYNLSLTLDGFKKYVRANLVITTGRELRADVPMELGTPYQEPGKGYPPHVYAKNTFTNATGQRLVPPRPCGAPR